MNDIRYKTIVTLVWIGGLLLIGHLGIHQLVDTSYQEQAQDRTLIKTPITAPRGIIFDRDSGLLVVNDPTYEIEIITREIDPDMDKTLFCDLLGISLEDYDQLLDIAQSRKYYKSYIPITFLSQIDPLDFAKFQEHLFRFPGFYPRLSNRRSYPSPHAAHVLGYISEVTNNDIEDSPETYTMGDVKGVSGIERVYEDELRGEKGIEYILKDNVGREVEEYDKGELDRPATGGEDLYTTLDIQLQSYGEELMANKRGSIVAIEPATGEILAIVSAPSYDPNKLSLSKYRSSTYLDMLGDTINEPLLDRPIQATYPPGSIFKPIISLIAMQEGVWYPSRPMTCTGEYDVNKKRGFVQKCRDHPSPYNVQTALQHSCNTYYYQMIKEYLEKYGYNNPGEAMDELMAHLKDFGIGEKLGVDLMHEKEGFRPSAAYYDRTINTTTYKWRSSYVLSLGIGQGELELTTLQMANLAAIMANRGHYYTPHIIKSFSSDRDLGLNYQQSKSVRIDSQYFPPIIDGMEAVIRAGTGYRAYVRGLDICGKTGTSQNAGEDHSVFFGFAPKENPKIALAVYVENAGGGGTVAAPIAGLMIEKYLRDSIPPNRLAEENRVKEIVLTNVPET